MLSEYFRIKYMGPNLDAVMQDWSDLFTAFNSEFTLGKSLDVCW